MTISAVSDGTAELHAGGQVDFRKSDRVLCQGTSVVNDVDVSRLPRVHASVRRMNRAGEVLLA